MRIGPRYLNGQRLLFSTSFPRKATAEAHGSRSEIAGTASPLGWSFKRSIIVYSVARRARTVAHPIVSTCIPTRSAESTPPPPHHPPALHPHPLRHLHPDKRACP